jgi:penicillin amidase
MAFDLTPDSLRAALPDVRAPQRLRGLAGPVTVHRDAWGIPHVRAEAEADAHFAQGFVHAQDRLWHMEYDRRRAYGRWAEAAGPAALPEDRMMRRFRIGSASTTPPPRTPWPRCTRAGRSCSTTPR